MTTSKGWGFWRWVRLVVIGLPVAVCVFLLLLVGGLPVVVVAIAAGAVWGIVIVLKQMATQPPPEDRG